MSNKKGTQLDIIATYTVHHIVVCSGLVIELFVSCHISQVYEPVPYR